MSRFMVCDVTWFPVDTEKRHLDTTKRPDKTFMSEVFATSTRAHNAQQFTWCCIARNRIENGLGWRVILISCGKGLAY